MSHDQLVASATRIHIAIQTWLFEAMMLFLTPHSRTVFGHSLDLPISILCPLPTLTKASSPHQPSDWIHYPSAQAADKRQTKYEFFAERLHHQNSPTVPAPLPSFPSPLQQVKPCSSSVPRAGRSPRRNMHEWTLRTVPTHNRVRPGSSAAWQRGSASAP